MICRPGTFILLLHPEAAPSHKFPDDGILRDVLAADAEKIFQKFQQPVGLKKLGSVPFHAVQKRLRVLLEHGKLVDQSGIEHGVGALLEGENIFLLPSSDGIPHPQGMCGAGSPGSGIPHQAADQPAVRGGDPVVVVHVQAGQGADIDLILAFQRKRMGEPVVQPVDSLDDQDIVLSQLQKIPLILPQSGLEIKPGHFHPLSGEQIAHIPVEALHIDGLQAFKIIIAVLVQRRVLPVYEIIVHGDGMGRQAVGF